jgi:8-oxo-dGTP pyrophosphatase MutT (NUDIX family)
MPLGEDGCMIFRRVLGAEEVPPGVRVLSREAVRGVVIRGNSILMVHTANGDYKFPGGGLEAGEGHFAALKREFLEETGYEIFDEIEYLGLITEQRPDAFEEGIWFVHKSHYYKCKLGANTYCAKLDSYEEELKFKAIFVDIVEAYNNNAVLTHVSRWVERESVFLEHLIKNLEEL